MCNHSAIFVFLAGGRRRVKGVVDKGLMHVIRRRPASNLSGADVEHDSEVAAPFPGANVGEASKS